MECEEEDSIRSLVHPLDQKQHFLVTVRREMGIQRGLTALRSGLHAAGTGQVERCGGQPHRGLGFSRTCTGLLGLHFWGLLAQQERTGNMFGFGRISSEAAVGEPEKAGEMKLGTLASPRTRPLTLSGTQMPL
eukprot:RCo012512